MSKYDGKKSGERISVILAEVKIFSGKENISSFGRMKMEQFLIEAWSLGVFEGASMGERDREGTINHWKRINI